MKMRLLVCLFCSGFVAVVFAEPDESDFYRDTIQSVDRTVNLVKDYGASGSDKEDDSAAFPKAIDDMTALPSYNGPSVAAARCFDPEMEMLNVTMDGFEHQPNLIITEDRRKNR